MVHNVINSLKRRKTFLFNVLLAKCRAEKKHTVAVASSGIAITLLKGGRIDYSVLELLLRPNELSTANISPLDATGKWLRREDLILWDEATICHRYLFEVLNHTLQNIMNNNLLFGGKIVLFAGYFCQILPVMRLGRRSDLVIACLKCSPLWPRFVQQKLYTNMHVRAHLLGGDPIAVSLVEHAQCLLSIEEGRIPSTQFGNNDLIRLSFDSLLSSLNDLIVHVYNTLYRIGCACQSA